MEKNIVGAEWLVDARIDYARTHGLSPRIGSDYRTNAPWRLIWHRTQGYPQTKAACRTQAIQHRMPPHLWASYRHDYVCCTVPLDKACYALAHPEGTPETNHMRALQVEVFGFSEWEPNPAEADWLGRRVLRPILDAGYPINIWNILRTTDNAGYGVNGQVRIPSDAWQVFNGQGVHANVPNNSHWDTGLSINLRDVARRANYQTPTAPPVNVYIDTETGHEMYLLVKGNLRDQWYIVNGNHADPIGNAQDYQGSLKQVDEWIWSMSVTQNKINERRKIAKLPVIEIFAFDGMRRQKDGKDHAYPFVWAQSVVDRLAGV